MQTQIIVTMTLTKEQRLHEDQKLLHVHCSEYSIGWNFWKRDQNYNIVIKSDFWLLVFEIEKLPEELLTTNKLKWSCFINR
jgi:hypothetical protein